MGSRRYVDEYAELGTSTRTPASAGVTSTLTHGTRGFAHNVDPGLRRGDADGHEGVRTINVDPGLRQGDVVLTRTSDDRRRSDAHGHEQISRTHAHDDFRRGAHAAT